MPRKPLYNEKTEYRTVRGSLSSGLWNKIEIEQTGYYWLDINLYLA